MITYTVTDLALAAVIDGRSYTIARDNPVYGQVRSAIEAGESTVLISDLFRTADAIKRYTNGAIKVSDRELFYNDSPVHNVVTDKIFAFMTEGLPAEPLMKFLNRLLANPSKRAIDELYSFLEHKHLPVTEEGLFLVYKGITQDYKDCHSHTFDNHPGVTHRMPRTSVDADRARGCSYGFHVGSLEYATGFGARTVIVEVDPADVVSVPLDSNCQKLRTCKYRVLCDYQGPLPKPLYESPEDEEVWDVYSSERY